MHQIRIAAPAKINLRLKVTGRRADGYHLLSMLNSTIGLYDYLDFTMASGFGSISLSTESADSQELPKLRVEDNLVFRAAAAFFNKFNIKNCNLEIKLSKHIPVGAGLGGGSSDAASTLLTLSKYFQPELSEQERIDSLIDIALSIGSDLPFFLYSGLCYVTGIGQQVQKIIPNPLSGNKLLLVSPAVHISTQQIYKSYAKRHSTVDYREALNLNDLNSYDKLMASVENDLSETVFESSRECLDLIQALSEVSACVSSVTGSGSSIFCLPKNPEDSQALKDAISTLEALNETFSLNYQIVEFS